MLAHLTRKEFLAYVAGISDGEGCISVKTNGLVRFTITNTVKGVLQDIRDRFGVGSVGLNTTRKRRKNKPCYTFWVTNARHIRDLLNSLLPYLQIKKEAARNAIKVIDEWEARYKAYRDCVAGIHASVVEGKQLSAIATEFDVSLSMVYKIRDQGPKYGENCRGGRGKWFAKPSRAA